MKLSGQTSPWLTRALTLLAPTLVIACADDPPEAPAADVADGKAAIAPMAEGQVVLGKSSLESRNFDARTGHNAGLRFADAMVVPSLTGRFAQPDIAATFDETTGVTRTLMSHTGFLTTPAAGGPKAVALAFASGAVQAQSKAKRDAAVVPVLNKDSGKLEAVLLLEPATTGTGRRSTARGRPRSPRLNSQVDGMPLAKGLLRFHNR